MQQLVLRLDNRSTNQYLLYARDEMTESNDNNDGDKVQKKKFSIELDRNQMKMVTVMTKYTILAVITIIFNILYYVSLIFGTEYEWNAREAASVYFLAYSNMIKAFYGLSITAAIYLNFSFNHRLYFGICGKCHWCCYGLLIRKTKRKIKKNIVSTAQFSQTQRVTVEYTRLE